jgi:hypothetical protein
MTSLREAAQAALDALEDACGDRCNAEYNPCWQREVAETLRTALESPVQEPLTIERLRDALVTSRIIPPAAVEDPDEYDDGVTLFRIEALHRRIT